MELDITANIVPDHSLGGLSLRLRLMDIQELISGRGFTKKGSFDLVSPFTALYRLGPANEEIGISVDVRNGKIFKLTAYQGYQGKLFGLIEVGMRIKDAIKLEPKLFYDEAEEHIRCEGVEGLAIDVPEIDPPPELVNEMIISAISVYAKGITTLEGQSGNW